MKLNVLWVSLVAALSLLTPFVAGAKNNDQNYGIAGILEEGKNHVVYMRFYFTGEGVQTVKLFLVGINQYHQKTPSRYLTFMKTGSSKYYTLKQPIVVHQSGGDVKIAAGTKYWVWHKPGNFSQKASIRIALRVSPNIPRGIRQCVRTSSIGTSPALDDTPAYFKFGPASEGYCVPGSRWLTPVIH